MKKGDSNKVLESVTARVYCVFNPPVHHWYGCRNLNKTILFQKLYKLVSCKLPDVILPPPQYLHFLDHISAGVLQMVIFLRSQTTILTGEFEPVSRFKTCIKYLSSESKNVEQFEGRELLL